MNSAARSRVARTRQSASGSLSSSNRSHISEWQLLLAFRWGVLFFLGTRTLTSGSVAPEKRHGLPARRRCHFPRRLTTPKFRSRPPGQVDVPAGEPTGFGRGGDFNASSDPVPPQTN